MLKMAWIGLKIILCKQTQKQSFLCFVKKYTSKEIVPTFFEIHGTEMKCEKEVKL